MAPIPGFTAILTNFESWQTQILSHKFLEYPRQPMPTTEEIRTILHESIENTDDPEVLSLVQEILQRKYTPEESFRLTENQSKQLDQARAEIERGEFLSNDQANALVDEWLNK